MQKRHVFGGVGLVATSALFLLWCSSGPDKPAREPEANGEPAPAADEGTRLAAPNEPVAPGNTPSTPTGSSGSPRATEPASNGAALAEPAPSGSAAPSGAAARINTALGSDPRDLSLFARIERELKRDPPKEVHELVALRARGATRETLLAETRRLLPNDFALRALVVRWIDEVAPAAEQKAPAAPSGGRSGGPLVQPIHMK